MKRVLKFLEIKSLTLLIVVINGSEFILDSLSFYRIQNGILICNQVFFVFKTE